MSHLFFLIFLIAVFVSGPLQAQRIWDGGGGNDQWNDPLNWSGNTLPLPADDVVLDHSIITGTYVVVLPGRAVTVRSIVIDPGGSNEIQLVLPPENKDVPGLTLTGSGYSLVINNKGIFRNASGASSGTPLSVADSIRINNGGRFIHNTPRAHAANTDKLSTAPGTEDGIFEFDIPDPSTTISLSGKKYGRLILSAAAAGGSLNYTAAGTNRVILRGGLEIGDGVIFNLNFSDTIFVRKDFVERNAVFDLGTTARSVVFAVEGDVSLQGGGMITATGTGGQQILFLSNSSQLIAIEGQLGANIGLVKDGPATATLSKALMVPASLEMRNGKIISSEAAMLQIASGSRVIADSLSGNSFVEGPVLKQALAGEYFLFPVGANDRMRWLAVSGLNGDVKVEYVRDNPRDIGSNYAAGIDHISGTEYWKIDGNINDGSFRLSFNDPQSGGVTDLSSLRVARWNNNLWENAGNEDFRGAPGSNGWVSSIAASGFSAGEHLFALASAIGQENPLPLSLSAFTVHTISRGLLFKWTCESPEEAEGFLLQRGDAQKQFETIRQVIATNQSEYSLVLPDSDALACFYRIVVVAENNGGEFLSRTVRVSRYSKDILLHCSLSDREVSLSIDCIESQPVKWTLMSIAGQVLVTKTIFLKKGLTHIREPVQKPARGIYLISLSGKNGVVSKQFFSR